MPLFRFSCSALLLAAGFFAPLANAATTLNDAYSLWLFDAASSGNATAAQILDSKGGHNATSTNAGNSPVWTTVPSVGPAGGAAVNTNRGLSFSPIVVQNAGATVLDSFTPATFSTSTGGIAGSSSILTRFLWAGVPSASDDNPNPGYQWILSNGYGGSGVGYLFGINTNSNKLTVLTSSGTGNSTSVSSFTLTAGLWYDVAVVVDATTNTSSFYAYAAGGSFLSSEGTSQFVPTTANNGLLFGAEGTGSGTGNQRKAFNGTMDYLAMFNTSVSKADVQAIFAAPEPSRGLLLTGGFMLLLLQRKRRSAVSC